MNHQNSYHIALAFSFSPRMEGLIAEAAFLARCATCNLSLLYSGKITNTEKIRLSKVLDLIADLHPKLILREGDVVQDVLSFCRKESVNLLILGAIHKEGLFNYYLGSIARDLCRKAPCSVLLITRPSSQPIGFSKTVLALKSRTEDLELIKQAWEFAPRARMGEIELVVEQVAQQLAVGLSDMEIEDADPFIDEMRKQLRVLQENYFMNETVLQTHGKPGHSACNEAREKKADLLMMRAPDNDWVIFDRLFPQDIEYALADLPTNLLAFRNPS